MTNPTLWPDLDSFRDLTVYKAIARLLPLGYKPVDNSPGCRIFRDAAKTHLLTLSSVPALAEEFNRACDTNRSNPHLPKIFESRTLGPSLHVRISENLNACTDFPEEERITICGLARAFSSLFEGDDIHVNVHPALRQDEKLLGAVRSVIACGEELTRPANDSALPVKIEHRGHSVFFRPGTNEPVFASPLVPACAPVAVCHDRLQMVKTRFTEAEMTRADSPYWPKIPVQKVA
jgi:hypothetical protein